MRSSAAALVTLAGFLSCFMVATAGAEDLPAASDEDSRANYNDQPRGLGSDPEDPQNLLPDIQERRAETDSLLPVSPLHWLHESTDRAKQALYDAVGLEAGFAFTHLFQGLSEARSDEDHRWPRPSRPRLRLVHRGVRHRRSEGGEGAARRIECMTQRACDGMIGY